VTDSKPEQTFVLVPGAWLGGWSWHPVARLLTGRGYPALALNLPGLSYDGSPTGLELADAVDYVVSEVERHRLAGRVAKVIYFSAVVPAQGTSMAEENEQYGEIIRQAITASPDATVPVGLDAVQGVLMPGDPALLQELVSQLLLPQPGGYMTGCLDLPPVTKIGLEAAYVLCADDIALARPGAEFAARLGVDPLVIPGNHMTMLTQPAIVADALLSVL
jgi:hypothetical protein